ncbi:hypothetical protein GCM10019016_041140 [Streptomyces prasinosporus]|uniref:Methyltransferase FkbM domain-containing protein n=1 Tax=Streptomyces prasinosporus TaxID=68256 RepID=A0ABP6TNZ9_9ACTN
MARLWLPDDDAGAQGVSSLVRRDIHGHALDVTCVALDDLGLRDVGFLKIDVDGNEPAVLRGATGILARDRPALFVELESRIQPIAPVVTYLSLLGYDGWVLPAGTWIPLSRFPLEAHQKRTAYVATHGLLRRILPYERLRGPRYVNSVLFLPDGRRPGERPVGDDGSRAHRTTPHLNRSPRSTSSWCCCGAWPTTTPAWWRTPGARWARPSPTCGRPTGAGRRWSARRAPARRCPGTARCSAPRSRGPRAGSATWTARHGGGPCRSGRTCVSRC